MEVTCGLLSNLVQTKSVERVLAPIASQISLLIILDHSDGIQTDMGPCAEMVMQAAERLVTLGKERANKTSDDELKRQMESACEILDLSSSDLYIASQRVTASASKENKSRVITASKNVLQGTMKVLLVSDDYEVRRILAAAHTVSEAVGLLSHVDNMTDLLSRFKSFTDTTSILTSLANKRQKDLCQDRQREKIITALNLLKKSIPSISVALQSCIKYPSNAQAHVSKSYVINQVLSAVRDIVEAIENKFTEEDYLDVEEPGYFVSKIDQILEALSTENREDLDIDVESWTEGIIRHSMLVAHLCTDTYRNLIIINCQRILQLKGRVLALSITIKEKTDIQRMREDYDECCESLIDEFCELEKNVNMSLLHLIVDIFKETTEPIERLIKAAMYPKQDQSIGENDILITEFEEHADKMCQVASFAAASSTDATRVRVIRTCVCHLERLDPDIVPAALCMARDQLDKMAVRHVKLLMKEWSFELNSLMQILDEMTDPQIFMAVSEKRIEEDIGVCRGYVMTCDVEGISSAIKSLVGRSRRVCQVGERIVDSHDDPLYRNGLLVYVKSLHKAITGIRAGSTHVYSDVTSNSAVESLLRRLSHLLECVRKVKNGLNADNQPSILSPERRNLRFAEAEKRRKTSSSSHIKFSSTGALKSLPLDNRFLQEDICSEEDFLTHSSISTLQKVVPLQRSALQQSTESLQSTSSQESFHQTKVKPQESYQQSKVKPVESYQRASRLKSSQDPSTTSHIKEKITGAVTKGDKHVIKSVSGDLLGWSNHIVDSAECLLVHSDTAKRRSIHSLCSEVDELVADLTEKLKYVAMGDQDDIADICSLSQLWEVKIEKIRVFIDVTVDQWKDISDPVYKSTTSSDQRLMKQQIDSLKQHTTSISELMDLTESMDDKDIGEERCQRLQENSNELDNITVTIVTTSGVIYKSSTHQDKCQLEQLCREWAVRIYCVLDDLEGLTSDLYTKGCDRKVWPSDSNPLKDSQLFEHILHQNSQIRNLLHSACLGNDSVSELATSLCLDQDGLYDSIKSTSSRKKREVDKITVTYICCRLGLLSGQWIVKSIKCMDILQEQTLMYTALLNKLSDSAVEVRTAQTDAEKQMCMSEFQLSLSKFSESLMSLRQKTLQGIQLSTELDKRSAVRKCLDEVTGISPQLIDIVKKLTEDGDLSNTMEEFTKQKVSWAAKVHQLLVCIQQMKDLKPGLVKNLNKVLGVKTPEDLTPAATLEPSVQPVEENDNKEAGFKTVHEELLCVTSEKQNMAVGQFSKVGRKKKATDSPYKPNASVLAASKYLQSEAEKWEDDCNPIVKVAKEMSSQINKMTGYIRGEGQIQTHEELVKTARSVAENGRKMMKFAEILSQHCVDKRFARDLIFYANQIPTVSTQLSIIANVHQGSSGDGDIPSNEEVFVWYKDKVTKILTENAENLMKIVLQTMKAAEAVCVKGLKAPEDSSNSDATSAIVLATQWQRRLIRQRQREIVDADTDDLGLRRIEEHRPPKLTQIFKTE
ncbi:uncharacterized protein LOC143072834 isoform X1 [Mytilus galloprovincialis]|uniref:uncharacterized protein LOC143072834 isoform X1 n=1 Tax=Mytilus galloprovincialis TaxID=29158 RepID=UPI003F7BFB05